jgi:endonuclease/exonuclease/phosphatase family metal-dependent hydrolase
MPDVMNMYRSSILIALLLLTTAVQAQRRLRVVELNGENLFYPEHHEGKNDLNYTPNGLLRWGFKRFHEKLENVARTLLAVGEEYPPDLVGLCEVEDDSVMVHLTRRTLLRNAGYRYVMTTASPDARGINVVLMYQPLSFHLLTSQEITVEPLRLLHPTRNILHVAGQVMNGDTLDVVVTHMPSKLGGDISEQYRRMVAQVIERVADSLREVRTHANILVMGDMNEGSQGEALQHLMQVGALTEPPARALNGAVGTYKYNGEWSQIDHIFYALTGNRIRIKEDSYVIADYPFLMEPDKKFGGRKPYRTYYGRKYRKAFSDHLPLRLDFELLP